jgi:hypothetical protein
MLFSEMPHLAEGLQLSALLTIKAHITVLFVWTRTVSDHDVMEIYFARKNINKK